MWLLLTILCILYFCCSLYYTITITNEQYGYIKSQHLVACNTHRKKKQRFKIIYQFYASSVCHWGKQTKARGQTGIRFYV